MATIIEKKEADGKKNNFILVGAGKNPAGMGESEEPFLIACDNKGCIRILSDFACTVKVLTIDGKTPAEILK